ncbi:coiled-coil domain-containing protein 146 [Lepisosteus oculatus]|uniref:coiled-coil domain-containing protein 146 n=1 Tax=Lepisosteus oculatus TaxID=7918 RepID=UPI003714880A
MSHSEESNPPSEEEDESPDETPLSALAPRADLQEEQPADVSASPAIQCLNELFSAGKIPGTRAAELKASYTLLHDTLKRTQESEIRLLQDAKRFTAQIERQRQDLEQAEQFPEGSDSEVSRMRQQLLKFYNDLKEVEDREDKLHYDLQCLREERAILEKEYETLPKPGELEKKTKALKDSCEELRREIAQRRLEIKALKEDMETKQKQIQREQHELDEKKETVADCENELVQLHSIPGQLGKEIERINHKKMDLEKKKDEMEAQVSELLAGKKQTEAQCRKVEEEKKEVMKELEGKREQLGNTEQELSQLLKEQDMTKEKEATLMGERAVLDLNLRHASLEKKTQHDTLSRKLREKERQLRSLKKMELQLKLANDTLVHTQFLHEKVKSEMDALPKDDGSALERRKELQKEVEMLKRNLLQQQTFTMAEAHKVEQCLAEEQELIKDTHRYREELTHLICLAQIKADEREQKSRDFVKAEQRYNRIKQELRGKSLVIQEHKKQNQEVQTRLNIFAKMYDFIKNERNKCVFLIQTASQRAAEMREKLKILENEVEILRTNAVNKERLLQKSKLKHLHSHTLRDSLRNDISKVNWVQFEMKDKREEQKLNIGKLTHMINHAEEALVQLRKKYESAVQNRNDRGVQLIEREEEVCIFYEKVNIQESLIRNGNMEIQAMEEEICFLKMLISEEARQLELLRKNLPSKRALEREVVTLQIQLSECQDRVLELEKTLEDPETQNRTRVLEGKDPTPPELVKKIEQLEIRLAEREEQLLEKELVYEQVTRLSQRIRAKADNGKHDTLALAKKVNQLQSKIKETTRKMMAVVSELSMQQANAMALQEEIKMKENFLESCHRRLEQGLPPSEDMELEWLKTLREEKQHKIEAENRAKAVEEEDRHQLPSGVYTTAEARPNAYIPQEDALPLPRPYGALAPFKPSEPGTNMRHIRKPVPKPIEI